MNLFGRKKAEAAKRAPDPAQAILQLRQTVETLDKRQVHLDKKIEQQVAEAKQKMGKKDKRGALYCLKRKKMYEKEVEKINGARLTLEQQIIAIEGTVTNTDTIEAMKLGKRTMESARAGADADTVADLMDDINEEMEQANEISEAISAPAHDVVDDEDLLNELNELEELELESQLLEVPAIPSAIAPQLDLPDVPVTQPKPAVFEEEDPDQKALRELEASMAIPS